jgi:hypothetical protein
MHTPRAIRTHLTEAVAPMLAEINDEAKKKEQRGDAREGGGTSCHRATSD